MTPVQKATLRWYYVFVCNRVVLKYSNMSVCVTICTFEVGDFQLFVLLQFLIVLFVFVQQPVVVLALDLVLLHQIVILLLQVIMLVLTKKEDYCHKTIC